MRVEWGGEKLTIGVVIEGLATRTKLLNRRINRQDFAEVFVEFDDCG